MRLVAIYLSPISLAAHSRATVLSGSGPPRFFNILLGPVHTMRTPIDVGHFFSGQGALSVVYPGYTSESATRSRAKMAPSRRVGRQFRPCGVAPRSFGATTKTSGTFLRVSPEGVRHRDVPNKPRSARLAWPKLTANAGHPHSVNRP